MTDRPSLGRTAPAPDPVAFLASALAGLPPEAQGAMLADMLAGYVLTCHRLHPDMPPEEIGKQFSAYVRAALARLAEETGAAPPHELH